MNTPNPPCILVVDDQDNWRDALTDLLSDEGYSVKTAAFFDDAISELNRTKFAVVVLDIRLVDIDIFNVQGVELLKVIKSQSYSPKVIMLTGYPESVREGVLDLYGADDLILKVPPQSRFDTVAFLEKIHKLIG
jgi:DNA-binding response OmpR family regulator